MYYVRNTVCANNAFIYRYLSCLLIYCQSIHYLTGMILLQLPLYLLSNISAVGCNKIMSHEI